MKFCRIPALLLALLWPKWGAAAILPENPYVVDTSHSPHASLRPVPFDAVEWTQGFWPERFRQLHDVTLREMWRLLADPNAGHVLDNFRFAAAPGSGSYAGTNWQDEWLYKWIEAASCVWRTTRDPWIDARMDEGIALIAAAQEPDGYLSTKISCGRLPRFTNPGNHEFYNMGHLLTAAVIHNRMTGKTNLLDVARRTGDYLCRTLGVTVEPYMAHNPSAIMGLVELYRLTGDKKYLDCAEVIVDTRGRKPAMRPDKNSIQGTDLIQDRVPIREATEMVGQNVFSTYLYTGAGDVYSETGDESLEGGLDRLWENLTTKKMYIHGGISALAKGVSNNAIVYESVGPVYDLPNTMGYNETCGQVGCFMWSYRMLANEADARYADVMEREMYNGFLGGIGLDGKSWFYRNVLRRYDADYDPAKVKSAVQETDMSHRSQPGRKNVCCPSNLLRTFAEMSAYFYSVGDDGLWVHQFGGTRVTVPLAGGEFSLEQRTDYPADGTVKFVVRKAPAQPVSLRVRVPGWAEGVKFSIDGAAVAKPGMERGYAVFRRVWRAGEVLMLDSPMPARLMTGNPDIEATRNQVAVMRGPLVYCLESTDLPTGVTVPEVYLPSDLVLKPQKGLPKADGELAADVLTLTGEGIDRSAPAWNGLYRPLDATPLKPVPLRFIPYYAWANRGKSAMSVWLPVILK